jgi:Tfp pilus assembly protein PilV
MHISRKNTRPRRRSGLTLIEVVVTMGLTSMFVLGVLNFTTITFQQGIFALGNYTDLNYKSRRTLDRLSQDIRSAAALTSSTSQTNSITMQNPDGTTFSYTWDGSNNVTRVYGGVTTVMMVNCDFLSFNFYQRNPTNGLAFVSTTNTSQVKLINVDWRCSRSYIGRKLNTESVQTARVVMRN